MIATVVTGAARESWHRACNYFTLLHLLAYKEQNAGRIWRSLGHLTDLSRPLGDQDHGVLSRFGLPTDRWTVTYRAVVRHMAALHRDDLILELDHYGYPELLADTSGAPPFLFVRGRAELLHDRPAIAVVGTRQPTDDGRLRARKLGYLLAKRGVVVMSGLARGIDAEAHRGALEIGGDTIAVLGTPLTRVYPREHAQLQEQIGTAGALVSQFYPGAGVQRHFFPMRNATMSGLCLGTVVVEASETSGALIQAKRCLQQGRKLFIPQSAIDDERLRWPRQFEQRGAHVFRMIEDLFAVLEQEGLVGSEEEASVPQATHVVTLNAR